MSDSILATLASVPFAAAVTALLRKRWPSIDGGYVAIVVLALTALAGGLGYYAAQVPPVVWALLGPVLAAVLALGGVQTAQDVARKAIVISPTKPE